MIYSKQIKSFHSTFFAVLFLIFLTTPFHAIRGMDNNNDNVGKKIINIAKWFNPSYLFFKTVASVYHNTGWDQDTLDKSLFHSVDLDHKNSYDIKFLLQKKANPNVQYSNGRTALLYAVFNNQPIDTISLLIQHGADYSAQDNNGETIFHYALQITSLSTITKAIDKFNRLCEIQVPLPPTELQKILFFVCAMKKIKIHMPKFLTLAIFNSADIKFSFHESRKKIVASIAQKDILNKKNNRGKSALDIFHELKN